MFVRKWNVPYLAIMRFGKYEMIPDRIKPMPGHDAVFRIVGIVIITIAVCYRMPIGWCLRCYMLQLGRNDFGIAFPRISIFARIGHKFVLISPQKEFCDRAVHDFTA